VRRVLLTDPFARDGGGLTRHVLAGGIARGVIEAGVEQVADGVLLDLDECADARRGVRRTLDVIESLDQPLAEAAGLPRVGEHEHRRPLHRRLDDGRLHASALGDDAHAAAMACHQRAFRRRQRNVEIALRMLAVNAERAGEADRHLRHPDEVLDVPRGAAGFERAARDLAQIDASPLRQELPPACRHLGRVVIGATAWNRYAVVRGMGLL
jgi:hypothetical protein